MSCAPVCCLAHRRDDNGNEEEEELELDLNVE